MLYGKNFGSMNYDAAEDQCDLEADLFSLLVPKSEIENDFISSLILGNQQAWLGITDEGGIHGEVRTDVIYTV